MDPKMNKKPICDQCAELRKKQAKKRKADKKKREFKKTIRRGFMILGIMAIITVIVGAVL